jgi:hypothetical protein
LNVRYHELTEAPLADYQLSGDFSTPSNLKDADRKLVQHPVHIKKMEKFFSKCPFNFRIVICNDSNHELDGQSGGVLTKQSSGFMEKEIGLNQDQINKIFDNAGGAITCIFTVNDSDDPLTPWITAHRIGHMYDDVNHDALTKALRYRLMQVGDLFVPERSGERRPAPVVLARALLTSKAARTGTKLQSEQEAAVELFAEYVLRGHITLNPIPDSVVVNDYSGMDFDKKTMTRQRPHNDIHKQLEKEIGEIMQKALQDMVGKVYLY